MEQSRNAHQYKRLSVDKPEIRILELLPNGSADSKICANLVHANLDLSPAYDALSYTWGDASISAAITLDDNQNFHVTYNAACALSDLRSDTEAVYIWIDAVSINQQDPEERSRQVSLMRRIYEQARVVRTWLEYELDTHSAAFQKLVLFNEQSSASDLGDDPSIWRPVADIAELPYWKRVWIQQEVAFARSHVIHCRKTKIGGHLLARFQALVHQKGFSGTGWIQTNWFDLQGHFMHLAKTSQACINDDSKIVQSLLQHNLPFKTLLEALSQSRHLESTDARDRVYALLGLVEDLNVATYKIDYGASVSEVYSHAAVHTLQHSHSLDFLCQIAGKSTALRQKLPSWVPDWSASNLGQPDAKHLILDRRGGAEYVAEEQACIVEKGKSLLIFGMRIGRITKVYSKTVWNAEGKQMPYLEDWADLLELDLAGVADEGISTETFKRLSTRTESIPPDRWSILLGTLLGLTTDTNDHSEFPLEEWQPFLARIFPIALQLQLSEAYALDEVLTKSQLDSWFVLFDNILIATLGKYIVVMDGCLGLAPPQTQVGDEVWVVRQCSMFMVLRPGDYQYHEAVGPIQLTGPSARSPIDTAESRGVELAFQALHLR